METEGSRERRKECLGWGVAEGDRVVFVLFFFLGNNESVISLLRDGSQAGAEGES